MVQTFFILSIILVPLTFLFLSTSSYSTPKPLSFGSHAFSKASKACAKGPLSPVYYSNEVPDTDSDNASQNKPPPALGFGKTQKPKKSLKTRQKIPQPLQPPASEGASSGVQIPGADKFTLVYTCKVCDERNIHKISKVAYNSGIVIVNCKGCKNKHLIADNNGLLDVPDFKNIKQYLESKGETVMTPTIDSVTQLKDYDLQENEEGDIELVPTKIDKGQ